MPNQLTPSVPLFPAPRAKKRRSPSLTAMDAIDAGLAAAESLPKLLSPQQVAAILGVTQRTLERWRITGEGPPFVRLSRSTIRYSEPAIAAFVVSRVRQNTAQ